MWIFRIGPQKRQRLRSQHVTTKVWAKSNVQLKPSGLRFPESTGNRPNMPRVFTVPGPFWKGQAAQNAILVVVFFKISIGQRVWPLGGSCLNSIWDCKGTPKKNRPFWRAPLTELARAFHANCCDDATATVFCCAIVVEVGHHGPSRFEDDNWYPERHLLVRLWSDYVDPRFILVQTINQDFPST